MSRDFQQPDLFHSNWLPSWLPDESLYSLSARYHRLSGHVSSKVTARILYGHARRGYQHDFCAGIGHLATVSRGSLGEAIEIARSRSMLPYFLPFRSADDANEAVTRMCGTSVHSLKYQLGILTSRFRANHPLKSCLSCIQDDVENHGVPYWHLSHQYPTSLLCTTHREPLWLERSKSDGRARFEWLLPDEIKRSFPIVGQTETNQVNMRAYSKVTDMSLGLAQLPASFRFDNSQLRKALEEQLTNHSLMASPSVLRKNEAARSYIQKVGCLSSATTLQGLPSNVRQAIAQLNLVLRKASPGTHPARILSIVAWLWEDWADFIRDYDAKPVRSRKHASATTEAASSTAMDSRLENLLIDSIRSGASISAAAKSVGIATATAQRLAVRHGISIERRSKKLTVELQRVLIAAASKGRSKRAIARILDIDRQTVMRFINTEPGLAITWKDACARRVMRGKRTTWEGAVERIGHLGTRAVREREPAAYAWLYRNDRKWLVDYNQRKVAAGRNNNSAVDWPQRDELLSATVHRVVATEFSTLPDEKKTLGRLCELIPELKAKLAKLDRLPITSNLVRENVISGRHDSIADEIYLG